MKQMEHTYSRLYIGPYRDADAFAIEVHQAVNREFTTDELAVCYADINQPSHCVRFFICEGS